MTPIIEADQGVVKTDNVASPGTTPRPSGRATDGQDSDTEVADLLCRMRSGDREAAAVFITQYGARVRRRVRGKLGPAMRRLFDSEEILSTVGRRLDLYVRSRRLEATCEGQLWQLIFKIADFAVLQKAHVFERLREVEGADSDFAQDLLHRLRLAENEQPEGAEKVIEQSLYILSNDVDRKVLSLWLAGETQESIGEELGITGAAVRKRWQVIKDKLRQHLGAEEHERPAEP